MFESQLRLTRKQLQDALGKNHDTIRQFEQLVAIVSVLTPAEIEVIFQLINRIPPGTDAASGAQDGEPGVPGIPGRDGRDGLTIPGMPGDDGQDGWGGGGVMGQSWALGTTQVVLGGGVGGILNSSANFKFDGSSPNLVGTSAVGFNATTYTDTAGNSPQNVFRHAGGTEALPTTTLSGFSLGAFSFRGYTDAGAFTGSKAFIAASATEDFTATANGTRVSIHTTPNGGTTLTERVRTDQSGYTGFFETAAAASSPVSLVDVVSVTGGIATLRRLDTSVTANDMVGKLQWYAKDTSTTTNFVVADIEAQATNTVSTDINPGRLILRTTPTGVAATPTQAVCIDENQRVAFGTSTAPTAVVHIKAGTATANTAPQQFTTGTRETTARIGLQEYDSNHYLTNWKIIRFPLGGPIFDHFADSTVGGAEADIYTNTLLADIFAINGDKVIASYAGNFVVLGTESTQLKAYFAGTAIWDSTGIVLGIGTSSWRVCVELIRVSATVVRYAVSLNTTGASGFVYCTSGELTGLTLTGTNILKLTGTSSGVGSGSGDIVGKQAYGEYKPAV